jgi:hypothetical protein
LGALALLVRGHRVDVSDLPRSQADAVAPARIAYVTAVDGTPANSASLATVRAILDRAGGPFRPHQLVLRTVEGRDVIVLGYQAPSPIGLFPSPLTARG